MREALDTRVRAGMPVDRRRDIARLPNCGDIRNRWQSGQRRRPKAREAKSVWVYVLPAVERAEVAG